MPGWTFAKPLRKVFYNITITSISVPVALVIGTIEVIGVLADQAKTTSGPLAAIADISLDYAGDVLARLFVVSWVVAIAVWALRRIEEKCSAAIANGTRPLRSRQRGADRSTASRCARRPSRSSSTMISTGPSCAEIAWGDIVENCAA